VREKGDAIPAQAGIHTEPIFQSVDFRLHGITGWAIFERTRSGTLQPPRPSWWFIEDYKL